MVVSNHEHKIAFMAICTSADKTEGTQAIAGRILNG
jgi:hypothetical protein